MTTLYARNVAAALANDDTRNASLGRPQGYRPCVTTILLPSIFPLDLVACFRRSEALYDLVSGEHLVD